MAAMIATLTACSSNPPFDVKEFKACPGEWAAVQQIKNMREKYDTLPSLKEIERRRTLALDECMHAQAECPSWENLNAKVSLLPEATRIKDALAIYKSGLACHSVRDDLVSMETADTLSVQIEYLETLKQH